MRKLLYLPHFAAWLFKHYLVLDIVSRMLQTDDLLKAQEFVLGRNFPSRKRAEVPVPLLFTSLCYAKHT